MKKRRRLFLWIYGVCAVLLVCRCLFPALTFISYLHSYSDVGNVAEEYVFFSIFSENNNYMNLLFVGLLYNILFILLFSLVLPVDDGYCLIRYRSRNAYLFRCVKTGALFFFLLAALMSLIQLGFAFAFFAPSLVLRSHILVSSAVNTAVLFIFYLRAGVLLMLMRSISKKKIAPILTIAVYAAEYSLCGKYAMLWFPMRDCTIFDVLMAGTIGATEAIPILIRGLLFTALLLIILPLLYNRKDILRDEKKQMG